MLAEEGQFPKVLLTTNNRTSVPVISLIIYTTIALVLSLTGTISLSQCYRQETVLCLLQLKEGPNPVSVCAMDVSAILIVICIWLLYASELSDLRDVVIVTGAGLLITWLTCILKNWIAPARPS